MKYTGFCALQSRPRACFLPFRSPTLQRPYQINPILSLITWTNKLNISLFPIVLARVKQPWRLLCPLALSPLVHKGPTLCKSPVTPQQKPFRAPYVSSTDRAWSSLKSYFAQPLVAPFSVNGSFARKIGSKGSCHAFQLSWHRPFHPVRNSMDENGQVFLWSAQSDKADRAANALVIYCYSKHTPKG